MITDQWSLSTQSVHKYQTGVNGIGHMSIWIVLHRFHTLVLLVPVDCHYLPVWPQHSKRIISHHSHRGPSEVPVQWLFTSTWSKQGSKMIKMSGDELWFVTDDSLYDHGYGNWESAQVFSDNLLNLLEQGHGECGIGLQHITLHAHRHRIGLHTVL